MNKDLFLPHGDLDRRNMTPIAIAISPARMNTIFNNTIEKATSTAHATNNNPNIITPSPSQTFMNQSISCPDE
jgi:hypothetical protein